MTNTVKKSGAPRQLESHIQALREKGKKTRDYVELAVRGSAQPLTTFEVANLVHQLSERKLDLVYVKKVLTDLVNEGVLQSRIETSEERTIRAGGKSVRGAMARLYWYGSKSTKRTDRVVVRGVMLTDDGADYTTWKNRNKDAGLLGRKKVQTGTLESIIDDLISNHVADLQARVADLENKLTGIKKALS